MKPDPDEGRNGQYGVAQSPSTPFRPRPSSGAADVLRHGRLDQLARTIAGLLRKAFVSAEEAAYVWRRARAKAGIAARPTKARRLPDVLSLDELRRLLAAGYRARPRDGLVIRLLFESAVRVAELARLEAPDVGLAERTVRVRQGKGGKDRVALIGEDLAQLLRVHLAGRDRGPLFVSNRSTRLSVPRIQSIVRGAARRAGVQKKISPHSLRHTWATLARNAGLPLDTIQGLLGHADPRTTEIYSRLALSRARAEYDAAMRAIAGSAEGALALPGAVT
jgi:integrase/recombinase XerD